jgi:tetratricopeptide (TPR) repeat protein
MSDENIIKQWLAYATKLAQQGRLDEAVQALQRVVEEDPQNLEVRNAIIRFAQQKGDYQTVIFQHMDCAELYVLAGDKKAAMERYETILRLEETVQLGPQNRPDAVTQVRSLVAQVKPEIYLRIGEFRLDHGQVDQALQYLKKSQELKPGIWDTHMALGRSYMLKEMFREAIGEFQEVLRLTQEDVQEAQAQAYEMLGEVFVRQGRPPAATVTWFDRAALLYIQKQMFPDACRAYERIIQADPSNKEAYNSLGELYTKLNMKEKAVSAYRVLADMYEKEGTALDKVIQLYETIIGLEPNNRAVGEKLVGIYSTILQRSPNNVSIRGRLVEHLVRQQRNAELPPHYFSMAQYQVERGMTDEAVKALRRLLEIESHNVEAREMLGDLYLRREMKNEALDEFQHVIRIYRSQGNDQAALELQQKMIQIFPEAVDLQYQVAVGLRDKGDYAGALQELDRLVAQRPDDLRALVYRGECLLALERHADAVENYERILRIDPGQVEVRRAAIGAYLQLGNTGAASQHLRLLPQEDPKRNALQRRLVILLLESKNIEGAEQEMSFLPPDDEQLVSMRKEIVKLYLDAGNLEKAFEALPQIPRSERERNSLVTRLLEIPLSQGDLDTAARTIHRLPEDDPLRVTFHRRLIGAYLEAGRLDEGAMEVARLPQDDEGRGRLISQVISGYLANGRFHQAAEQIYRLQESDPLRNSFMGQLIEALIGSGDLDSAAQEVSRLSQQDEIRPRYHRRLIQAYLNGNRFDEAEQAILSLNDSDPEKRSFLRLLVQKFLALGGFDRVRDLVAHMPDDMEEKSQYLDGLVHNYLDLGELNKARNQIFSMADLASSAGNHLEAERLYREILAYQPSDVDIRLHLCHSLASQGQSDRAREGMLVLAGRFHREGNATSSADVYSRMLDIDSNNLNARYRLGTLWAEQGQTAQALEQFAQLAKVYLEQNLPEVAQRVLKKILELDPKDIEHRRQAIRLLIRNLRFEEATEHYRILLGIHLERGEVDEALDCVKEIVNLQPLNLELRQQLGALFLKAGFLEHGQNLLESLAEDCREKRDTERMLRVLNTLAESFGANEQWETSLEYRERIADVIRDNDGWSKAQAAYLDILLGYLQHSHKESADAIFVKLVDGFFRYKVVQEGVEQLEDLQQKLSEMGKPTMSLVVRERIASILERQDQWDRAIQALQEISHSYLMLQQVDSALEFLRRAADQALAHDRVEQGIEILFQLAERLVEHRGLESARPVLDELLRTAQDNVPYLERVGDVLFHQGLFEEARPIYHEVLEKEPGRPESLSRIAIIYAKEGRLEDAADIARQIFSKGLVSKIIREYKSVTNFRSGDASSHLRLGRFYQQLGFVEEAILEYRRAANDPNRFLQACNQLAMCFAQQGYSDLAVRQFQMALDQPGYQEEDVDMLELRFNLACTFEEKGRYKEAMQAFQECFVVDIRYRDVTQRIEALSAKM